MDEEQSSTEISATFFVPTLPHEVSRCHEADGPFLSIFICPLPVILKIRKNMFWIEKQLANNTSNFCKKKPIRSGEINLQSLAMAAMFAREFFS